MIEDRFVGERLYGREHIAALLEDLGFAAVAFCDATAETSDRDADLGMMACRQLVLARAAPDSPGHGTSRLRERADPMNAAINAPSAVARICTLAKPFC